MSVRAILLAVEAQHGILVRKYVRGRRYPHLVAARRDAMYLMRTMLGLSFPTIAREFSIDHTSVMQGVRCVAASLAVNADHQRRMERLRNAVVAADNKGANEVTELRALAAELGRRIAALEVAA